MRRITRKEWKTYWEKEGRKKSPVRPTVENVDKYSSVTAFVMLGIMPIRRSTPVEERSGDTVIVEFRWIARGRPPHWETNFIDRPSRVADRGTLGDREDYDR